MTFDGEYRYTYDDEGNRIAKGKTKYFWDHRNRLVKVVTPKQTVEYQYDYRNRLTRRNDEFFVHDGWQIVCSLKNGKVADRYLWGARQDELLCENNDFVLTDHLGTIRKIVDKSRKAVSSLNYNAFGKLISSEGIMPRFRYTAKLFDDATELQWNINRWYDVEAGRWISEDPIEFEGMSSNTYAYALNSPLKFLDLFGLVTHGSTVVYPTLPPDDHTPADHGKFTPGSDEHAYYLYVTTLLGSGDYLGAYYVPHAMNGLRWFLENSGTTRYISAKEFLKDSSTFQDKLYIDVENLFTHVTSQVTPLTSGSYVQHDSWSPGAVESPIDWRGLYRGYHSFAFAKIVRHAQRPTDIELEVVVVTFKNYNFDNGETFGNPFDLLNLTGTNLNILYTNGLAMNYQI